MRGTDVNKIEHHLEFYNANGEQLEHYGNMAKPFIPPRKVNALFWAQGGWRLM
jgi:hypothetical protein